MPVLVKRLHPANFDTVVFERDYLLARVGRTGRLSFDTGVADFFAARYPARFSFGIVQRTELASAEWVDGTFRSAVGRVRGGAQDGYYLFHHGVVVGHHRGEVRAGVHYGNPDELEAQRKRVWELGFAGRRVHPDTLEKARAIVVYFDDIVARKEGAAADTHRWVREEREPAGGPARPSPAPALVDPYEVLGVARSATDDELKTAYRQGLKMNHPDKVSHLSPALQKFAETQTLAIVDAYERIKRERDGS